MPRLTDVDRSKEVILVLLLTILFGFALSLAGEMEKTDEERELEHYCEMVNSGAWGNYKRINLKKYCD
jgi:hypothetical protein